MTDENTDVTPQGNTEGQESGQETVLTGGQSDDQSTDKPNSEEGQGKEGEKTPEGTDDTPEGDKADDKSDGDQKEGAPDSYDLKAPEGLEIDDEAVKSFTPVFQELGLNNEQAQKLTEAAAPWLQSNVERVLQAQQDAFFQQQEADLKALQNDPEFGGKNWEENKQMAIKACNAIASPDVKKFLDESGMGNNPNMIRMFAEIGRKIGDDNLIVEGEQGNNKFNASDLYKNSNMNP